MSKTLTEWAIYDLTHPIPSAEYPDALGLEISISRGKEIAALLAGLESANAKLTAALSERTEQANDYEQALIAESAKSSKLEEALAEARAKLDQAKRELAEASAKIEELEIGHARYEYLRKLNPRQFTELYQQNISTAVPFDTLVDEARAPTAGENNERKDFV